MLPSAEESGHCLLPVCGVRPVFSKGETAVQQTPVDFPADLRGQGWAGVYGRFWSMAEICQH